MLNMLLTHRIPPTYRDGGPHLPPTTIGSVQSLSGHAIAYLWRSLPRVHQYSASKPQSSSNRVLPWQITMDQLIWASLSHNQYWYRVGMFKVTAIPWLFNTIMMDGTGVFCRCFVCYWKGIGWSILYSWRIRVGEKLRMNWKNYHYT